jgi:LPS O-antigen subunit length determinant protein (WzzB/FepE family)
MNNQMASEQNYYQEDEIDLKQLFRSLADRKWFIFGFTGFITALAIAYALSIPPTYKASISFLSPSQSSVLQLNKIKLTSETSETIYRKFLNNIISSKSQINTFVKNEYKNRLNPNDEIIVNMDGYISGFASSIQIEPVIKSKNEEISNYEYPMVVTMEGGNSEVIADYLNDLSNSANKKTVDDLLAIIKQKITFRLDEISKQRGLLLLGAKQDRLTKIKIIKIEDTQKNS